MTTVEGVTKRGMSKYASHLARWIEAGQTDGPGGISATTAWTYYDYISAFLSWSVKWDYRGENRLKRPKAANHSLTGPRAGSTTASCGKSASKRPSFATSAATSTVRIRSGRSDADLTPAPTRPRARRHDRLLRGAWWGSPERFGRRPAVGPSMGLSSLERWVQAVAGTITASAAR